MRSGQLAGAVFLVFSNAAGVEVEWFMTTRSGSKNLTRMSTINFQNATGDDDDAVLVEIDTAQRFQEIYGIGSSLEGSTCFNLMQLSEAARNATLQALLDPVDGIGMNLMRITIGTSDFAPLPFYSYDDSDDPDEDLVNFSIAPDEAFVLPALRAALPWAANAGGGGAGSSDGLAFFASPWSPPGWMKVGGSLQGGQFNSSFTDAFGAYLVRFVEAYAAEGIAVAALTPQNEPLQNNDAYPTTLLLPEQEAGLIAASLGPRLEAAGLDCEIW